jgi:Protein of unknown function (DUF3828)
MIRKPLWLVALGLSLTAAGLPRADDAALRAAIRGIYAPYTLPSATTVSMERRVFSARTQLLINRWRNRRNSSDEVTPLGEGDWFCQCQDWEPKAVKVNTIQLVPLAKGKVRADVRYAISRQELRHLRFVMVREGGTWKVDDLLYDDQYGSLVTALRKEIAEAR